MSSSEKTWGQLESMSTSQGQLGFFSKILSSGISWCWLALVVIFLDQASKHLILSQFVLGQVEPVFDFFNLVLVFNPGAAWSFLADAGGWQRWFFAGVSVLASVLILGWLFTLPRNHRWTSISLVMILGGALGNLYDRIIYGAVVDFLDFHWSGYHFPAFNLADSAITIGAVMMVIDMFFLQAKAADRG